MKQKLVLLFGGKSAEHEVSLRSAQTIYNNLDQTRYSIYAVALSKEGLFYLQKGADFFKHVPTAITKEQPVYLANIDGQAALYTKEHELIDSIDIVFPIVHGPNGEDGTLQGFLTMLSLPFVGPSTLGSACAMDKEVAKILLNAYGLKTAKAIVIHRYPPKQYLYSEISSDLGPTLYVKPANMGSSVGVNRVTNAEEFEKALTEAFNYDHKLLIEQAVVGREIECAVLGNKGDLHASVVGEILPKTFYSYEAKYLNSDEAGLAIPANLDEKLVVRIQQTALKAYSALQCEGMSRIDMFLLPDGQLIINEANTLPGFTSISMYPALWQASGLTINNLLQKLIELAIKRFERNTTLKEKR